MFINNNGNKSFTNINLKKKKNVCTAKAFIYVKINSKKLTR